MSDRASAWAWQQHNLPTGVKFTLVALADEADDDGVIWIGTKNVAGKVDKSRSAVSRHVSRLETCGLIEISKQYNLEGQQVRNLYRLQLHIYYGRQRVSRNDQGVSQNATPPSQNETGPPQNGTTPVAKQDTGVPKRDSSPPPSLKTSLPNEEGDIDLPVKFKGPEWWQILISIGGTADKRLKSGRYGRCQRWLTRKGISEDQAERTAIDLKAKWGAKIGDRRPWPYKDVWATFQKWVIREPSAKAIAEDIPEDPQQLVTVTSVDGAADVWSQVLDILRDQVPRTSYETWLKGTIGVGYGQGGQVPGDRGAQRLSTGRPGPTHVFDHPPGGWSGGGTRRRGPAPGGRRCHVGPRTGT